MTLLRLEMVSRMHTCYYDADGSGDAADVALDGGRVYRLPLRTLQAEPLVGLSFPPAVLPMVAMSLVTSCFCVATLNAAPLASPESIVPLEVMKARTAQLAFRALSALASSGDGSVAAVLASMGDFKSRVGDFKMSKLISSVLQFDTRIGINDATNTHHEDNTVSSLDESVEAALFLLNNGLDHSIGMCFVKYYDQVIKMERKVWSRI